MSKINLPQDTIAAIATPPGQGGIGIVRVSGGLSLEIARKIFRPKNKGDARSFQGYTAHYGWIADTDKNDSVVDEVLLLVMRAPRSYTTEDVVEIHCHGGIVSLKAILNLVLRNGARPAEPGEFTKRAFLYGRIDLTQAEAVLDVIQSRTEAFLRVSTHQLKGDLTIELERIREILMRVYTQLEAAVNFPEDDTDGPDNNILREQLSDAQAAVSGLLSRSDQGRILKDGVKVVLCGRANVGKSSLLNVFLKTPRAIVSEVAGTTRDTIEELAQIRGVPFQIVDTAGILEPRDAVEEEAVKRSRMSIDNADLVILVIDAGESLTDEDRQLMAHLQGREILIVLNKSDLEARVNEKFLQESFPGKKILKVSALDRQGIDALEEAMLEQVLNGSTLNAEGLMVSNLRHIRSLEECRESLSSALKELPGGTGPEFISEYVKSAVNTLDEITGRNAGTDLIENIFAQFCIGK